MSKLSWGSIVQNKKITVIGAGKWGSAIADLLAQNSSVFLYSRSKKTQSWHRKVTIVHGIDDIRNADYIFIAIPTQEVGGFLKELGEISSAARIILCSKGIDISTGKLLSDVVKDVLPQNKICIFSGPNFSEEVMNKLLTVSTISCEDLAVAEDIAHSFSTDYFKFLPNADVVTTQICGALKNILAIACGVVHGLGMGENAVAAILTKGLAEIICVIEKFGGEAINITSAAGAGDIFLSCNSTTSRNNKFGAMMAKGEDIGPDIVVEGRNTIIALFENYLELVKGLPLLYLVYQLSTKKISGEKDIKKKLLGVFH